MAQACHAATAVLHTTRNEPNTMKYVEGYEQMHKVVLEVSKKKKIL
jgi:peptidyl-tRNA hydrolase